LTACGQVKLPPAKAKKLGSATALKEIMKKVSLLILLNLFSSFVIAASFDCTKATTFVEKTICSEPLLSKLDDALAENYIGMYYSNFGGTQKSLKTEQLKWLSSRNKCTDSKCLVKSYQKRIDETCDYGVVSGLHPICSMAEDIK
jgi:uncharacterized protein